VGGAKDTDVDVADGDPGGGKPTAKLLVKGRGGEAGRGGREGVGNREVCRGWRFQPPPIPC